MGIRLREMTAADWPQVSEIYRQGIDTGIATFTTEVPEWAAWDAAHLLAPRLVAEADAGALLGFAVLSPVSARAPYAGVAEVSIYVGAPCRGNGLGTELLSALCARAEQAGLWTLQSVVLAYNEASLRLHTRCGFRTVGLRERLAKDRYGIWRDVILMEKRNGIG